jgi:thiol-disulfide isomerase/thioredoxin
MLPLGTPVPAFELTNVVDGRAVSPDQHRGSPALLVMFICNHCPYVIHVRPEITRLVQEYMPKGVRVIAINSNNIETHPQDGPDSMKQLAVLERWEFPFAFDATQEVAKAFRAACTPDFFLFDEDQKLAYRGQLDDSRPQNGKPLSGADLRAAIEAVLAGKAPAADQKASIGCNIKWKPGNEPEWFGVPKLPVR